MSKGHPPCNMVITPYLCWSLSRHLYDRALWAGASRVDAHVLRWPTCARCVQCRDCVHRVIGDDSSSQYPLCAAWMSKLLQPISALCPLAFVHVKAIHAVGAPLQSATPEGQSTLEERCTTLNARNGIDESYESMWWLIKREHLLARHGVRNG